MMSNPLFFFFFVFVLVAWCFYRSLARNRRRNWWHAGMVSVAGFILYFPLLLLAQSCTTDLFTMNDRVCFTFSGCLNLCSRGRFLPTRLQLTIDSENRREKPPAHPFSLRHQCIFFSRVDSSYGFSEYVFNVWLAGLCTFSCEACDIVVGMIPRCISLTATQSACVH